MDAEVQENALKALLNTLKPEVLAINENLLKLISPRPAGLGYSRETFDGNTAPALDALGIAEMAADITVDLLLNPQRANRLVEYSAREGTLSLEKVIDELVKISWNQNDRNSYHRAIRSTTGFVVLHNLMELVASDNSNPLTKAVALKKLKEMRNKLNSGKDASRIYAVHLIDQFLENPDEFEVPGSPSTPPGSPIGN